MGNVGSDVFESKKTPLASVFTVNHVALSAMRCKPFGYWPQCPVCQSAPKDAADILVPQSAIATIMSALARVIFKGLIGFLIVCLTFVSILVVAFALFGDSVPTAARWLITTVVLLIGCPMLFALATAKSWSVDYDLTGWEGWTLIALLSLFCLVLGVVCFYGLLALAFVWGMGWSQIG